MLTILQPQIVIPKDQAYFYTPEWQDEIHLLSSSIRLFFDVNPKKG